MTSRRSVNRLVLLASLCILASLQLFAGEGYTQDFDCFSIVVGKKASADGSVMFGHNEDVLAPVVNLYKVPGANHPQGESVVLREGGKVPQVGETPGYFWLNVPGWDVCDGYVNEYGVAVGSDGCPSREEDPELTDGGILFWLRRLVAERARTAREGVKLAGDLIDRFGYNSSGRSYVIADQDEAWVLAAVNGKHWVAQRVPDDQVAVIANCYTIQEINLRDTANFLGSPDIVDYAVKRGWYDPSKDGKFSFAKAYSNPGSLAHPANIGRMWRGFDLLAGRKFDINKQIPFAVVPKKKLTPPDLMRTMRDRYNGSELEDPSQAYICHEGTRYSMISQIRAWMPAEIKAVVWLAMHRPDLQTYSAWYPAIGTIPGAYATEDHETGLRKHLDTTLTPDKRERSVAYARFVQLDDKIRPDSLASIKVKNTWSSFERESFNAQAEFEKKVARLLKRDPDKAINMITDHTAKRAQDVYHKAGELLNSLKSSQDTMKGNETIWQTKPGDPKLQWESQVFHLGNGYFGVSAYCGVSQEIATLAEKTFWTGGPGDNTGYNFGILPETDFSYVDEIKRLTAKGEILRADSLVAKYLCKDTWTKLGGLSTIGSLVLTFEGHDGEVRDYERLLDLKNSMLRIEYTVNNTRYRREYFCSYPDRVLVMRLTADRPGALSLGFGVDLMHQERNPRKTITPASGLFEVAGNMNDNNRPYRVKIKVINEGGTLSKRDSLLVVTGANAMTILYTVATDYKLAPPMFHGADPERITSDLIAGAASAGYEKLRQRHIADYQRLYNRTSLHLENPLTEREALPTNDRLFFHIYKNDARDLGLKDLAFNLGKYFLISVSRPGAVATGNQGTWNNRYQALWNGTYQLDMNVTQTYMFGNALNLSECQEPFIDYIKMLSSVGEKAAKAYYGTGGWTSFIISDLWGGVGTLPPAPFLSSGWLSLILWEQYAFDRNKEYLKEIYPILKGASQFYLENLIEYKDTKKLVFWGTYSAEHSTSPIGVTAPNFQDIAFIAETFENTTKAAEILGADSELRKKLQEARGRLMPFKVGRMGQFQEWVEDVDDPNCQHRHLSHLLALQPCKQVNPHQEAALGEAAKVTLIQRRDNDFVTLHRPDLGNSVLFPTKCEHEGLPYDYYPSQAWSRAARLCTWLRVHDGDHADKIQNDIFRESTLENMIQYETRAHYGDKPVPDVPFFVEGTVLGAGYVTEMVLQSQYGELELLPALPSAWSTGKITGIRGRGACTVDLEWKDNKLVRASIASDIGGDYTLRYKGKTRQVKIKKGETSVVDSF